MTEKSRIISLYEKLYSGEPWIDVNLFDTLSNITAEQASKKIHNCNTIWEIVVHMIAWRENVLRRLQGEVITTPANNYFSAVTDTSDEDWEKTLRLLERSQQNWLSFLKDYDMKMINVQYPANQMTHHEHIQGILQHDCYHLGQIVLLLKLI